jgi:glycine/D-amino acid oxidase-like deaminating enzyme/nitrite reductase/ring-hydroxylating ferredoxin subunit
MTIDGASNDSGATLSPWMAALGDAERSKRGAPTNVDVCVVGAGIAGLSVAYELALRGRRVLVLDAGRVGGGETARTSAHLASALDDRFSVLESVHGKEGARLAAESHRVAIDRIETITKNESIACDFARVDGYLFGGGADDDGAVLQRELEAATRAGLRDAEWTADARLGFRTGRAIRFPRQAEIHPIAYVQGLARAIERRGGEIRAGVRVTHIEDGHPPVVVCADDTMLRPRAVVVATNVPIHLPVALPLRQAAHRSYVVGLSLPSGLVAHALYWDTQEPYHYARVASDGAGREVLLVGGEDHRTGEPDEAERRFERLESWGRSRCPRAGARVYAWSGQVMEPVDGLAFIGRSPGYGDVYVVTGDSGHGLTHGAIAGVVLADMVNGVENRWARLYDPGRKTLRSAKHFLSDLGASAAHYADWLEGGDKVIPLGGGAVVRRGLSLVAVHRDMAGICHERSAACPHLGGVVAWNEGEKTWDCPCHGSRFDRFGRVVMGPATENLAPAARRAPPKDRDSTLPTAAATKGH